MYTYATAIIIMASYDILMYRHLRGGAHRRGKYVYETDSETRPLRGRRRPEELLQHYIIIHSPSSGIYG